MPRNLCTVAHSTHEFIVYFAFETYILHVRLAVREANTCNALVKRCLVWGTLLSCNVEKRSVFVAPWPSKGMYYVCQTMIVQLALSLSAKP